MTVADPYDWFPDDEFVVCPSCSRARALATKATGYYVCLECGLVAPNGAPVGRALTLVPPEQDREAPDGGCGDGPSPRPLRKSRTNAGMRADGIGFRLRPHVRIRQRGASGFLYPTQ